MSAKTGKKRQGNNNGTGVTDKDRCIAELKSRIAVLENELRLKLETASSIDTSDARRADEALRESEEKFRGLFDSMDAAVQLCELVRDDSGRPVDNIILDVNPSYEKHSGLRREQVVGRRIKEILPVVEQVWLDRYGEVVRTGKTMHFEEYNAALDQWFDVYASPMKGNRFAAVFADISERKRAEEKLRKSEERFRAVQENSLDRFTILKPFYDQGEIVDFTYVYQNAQAARTAGYRPEELVGRRMTEVFPTFPRTRFFAVYKRAVETGQVAEFEDRYSADGVDDWFQATVTPIPDGIAIATQIITGRKRAEEALREKDATMQAFFDAIGESMILTDEPGVIMAINETAARRLGKKPADLVGVNMKDLLGPALDRRNQYANEVRRTGKPVRFEDERNGIIFDQVLYPIFSGDGKIARFAIFGQDVTERRRMEDKVRESEAKYRAFFENSIDAILLTRPDGGIEAANAEACRIFGMTEEELIKAGRSGVVDAFDPRFLRALSDRTKDGGVKGELNLKRKDGTVFPGEISSGLFTDMHGNVKTAMIIRDITERKRVEEQISQLNQDLERRVSELQTLFDLAPISLSISLDKECRQMSANKMFMDLVGMKPGSNISQGAPADEKPSFKACLHGKELPLEELPMQKAALTGKPVRGSEFDAVFDDGHVINFYGHASPLFDETGAVRGAIGAFDDVTERKRAEEALRESEARLVEAQQLSAVGSWEWDVVRDKVIWSKTLYHIFRMNPELPVPPYREQTVLFTPESWQSLDALVKNAFDTGEPYDVELDSVGCDGSHRWVIARGTVVKDSSGNIIKLRGTVQDITERKRAEEDLTEAKQQAELYLDLMGHDISNMHQIALGQLELAQEILEAEGRLEIADKEMIDTTIKTLTRSAKLIENIRNIQKMRSGEYKFERIDLCDALDEAVKAYSKLPGRDIKIDCVRMDVCYVLANPLLKDVFNNLVDNAVKHCEDRVMINISVTPVWQNSSSMYQVVVEDNGHGVPDEKKAEIFNRLKRGQTKARGTGLGLYIVKTLVEGFGGTVNVEDRVSGDHTKGARFVVMLPAIENRP